MLVSGDQRIEVARIPAPAAPVGVGVVLIGHAPGTANWRELLAMPRALGGLRDLGYQRQIAALRRLEAENGVEREAGDAALKRLLRLPLALSGAAEFDALFPQARTSATQRGGPLVGATAFLPGAVSDAFAANPAADAALWVIATDEDDAGLPRAGADLVTVDPWRDLGAFEAALLPPDAGLIAFPDLERLMLPVELAPLPALEVERPAPVFRPCSGTLAPITVPDPAPQPEPPAPAIGFEGALSELARGLQRRPDMHALLTLPLAQGAPGEDPAPSDETLTAPERLDEAAAAGLRQIQLLFPFVRRADGGLGSVSGLLAGAMARSTRQGGPWRSLAGVPLSRRHSPFPPPSLQARNRYRDANGIGVLVLRNGILTLDDERLTRPAFGRDDAARSGEVARFIGWLRRELRRYGEQLVFTVDPRDPRPGLILDGFLRSLYSRGALNGRVVEDSYRLRQRAGGESTLIFEIELRPALPIDTIRIVLDDGRLTLASGALS